MGEAKRRRMRSAGPGGGFDGDGPDWNLPPWHSTFEEITRARLGGGPAVLAVKVGTEGALHATDFDNVRANLTLMAERTRETFGFLLVVEGFEAETRPPEDIPEVRDHFLRVARLVDEIGLLSRLTAETELLFTRCGAASWGVPVVRLNPAPPPPWRICDALRWRAGEEMP